MVHDFLHALYMILSTAKEPIPEVFVKSNQNESIKLCFLIQPSFIYLLTVYQI
jgi:hypothetical protein